MIQNKSGLHPKGASILLIPYEGELYRKDSRIIIPDSYKDNLIVAESRGIVLEIGPGCWLREPPRAVVGEVVLVSKFAGAVATGVADNRVYRVVNAEDIFLGIELDQKVLDEYLEKKYG